MSQRFNGFVKSSLPAMFLARPGLREIRIVILDQFILIAVPKLPPQGTLIGRRSARSFRAAVFYGTFVHGFIRLRHRVSFAVG
jgi:hypothetical protein